MWRSCERFGVRPPGVQAEFTSCAPWFQVMLIAYDQIRQTEEMKELSMRMF